MQRASLIAGAGILLVGVGALALVRPWGLRLPRWLVIIPALTGSAYAAAHALTAYVTKPLHAAGVVELRFDGWAQRDQTGQFLWDLLFYEPWFLGLGVLVSLATLHHHLRTGGSARAGRRLMLLTALGDARPHGVLCRAGGRAQRLTPQSTIFQNLPVRVLAADLAVAELEQVAPAHLDRLAGRLRSRGSSTPMPRDPRRPSGGRRRRRCRGSRRTAPGIPSGRSSLPTRRCPRGVSRTQSSVKNERIASTSRALKASSNASSDGAVPAMGAPP